MNPETNLAIKEGIDDALFHLENLQYKYERLKSREEVSSAHIASCENEIRLAMNHYNLLQAISRNDDEIKTLMARNILLGKLKVRFDKLSALDADAPNRSDVEKVVTDQIIKIGIQLKAIG